MFRLGVGIVVIGTIYMHSPLRPAGGFKLDLQSWTSAAERSLLTAAVGAGLGSGLPGATLRQTLAAAEPEPAAPAPATPAPATSASTARPNP